MVSQVKAQLEATAASSKKRKAENGNAAAEGSDAPAGASEAKPRLPPLLLKLLSKELNCDPEDVLDFELQLCDTQPSCVAGAESEFVHSGRLDNLCSSYIAIRALIDTCSTVPLWTSVPATLSEH